MTDMLLAAVLCFLVYMFWMMKSVHTLVNSRMSELLQEARSAADLLGHARAMYEVELARISRVDTETNAARQLVVDAAAASDRIVQQAELARHKLAQDIATALYTMRASDARPDKEV